jgi:hypothetical protein
VDQRGVTDEAAGAPAAGAGQPDDRTRDLGIGSLLVATRLGGERRRDDARADRVGGSLMRHFLPPRSIPRLARRMVQAPAAVGLVAAAGGS